MSINIIILGSVLYVIIFGIILLRYQYRLLTIIKENHSIEYKELGKPKVSMINNPWFLPLVWGRIRFNEDLLFRRVILSIRFWIIFSAVLPLALGCLVFVNIYQYEKTLGFLEEGLNLIKNGQIEEGLSICNRMYFGKGVCYARVLGYKLNNNETVTEEFCDSIPTENNFPFWFTKKQHIQDEISTVKNKCNLVVSKTLDGE